MLSKAKVLAGLQKALPEVRLMWQDDGVGKARIIATMKDAEHYIGVSLDEPGLTEEELVRSVVRAIL